MPRIQRRTAALAGIGAVVAAVGVTGVLWVSGNGGKPTDEVWPPVLTLDLGGTYPAIEAAYYQCRTMEIKHDWWLFTDMSLAADGSTLTIDQRPLAWIEDYYGHPLDTGTRKSVFNLDWIEEYLGHPLPDGYYLWAAPTCVLEFLGAPPEIMDQILATTPEDGEASEVWSTFEITWTNNGVDGPDAVVSYHRP